MRSSFNSQTFHFNYGKDILLFHFMFSFTDFVPLHRFSCPCGKGYSRADHFKAHAVKCDGYGDKEMLAMIVD